MIARFSFMALLLVLSVMPCCAANLAVGDAAPALTLTTWDQKSFDLSAHKGNIVMLHFWAPWCAPCIAEFPILDAYYRKHRNEGLEIVALDIDPPSMQTREDMKNVLSKYSFPGGFLRDVTNETYETPRRIPSTYIINRDGKIHDIKMPTKSSQPPYDPEDLLSEVQLDAMLQPLLKVH